MTFDCFHNFFYFRQNGQNQLLAKKQITFTLFRLLKLEQAQKSLVQVY